jgi:hypothetical protein
MASAVAAARTPALLISRRRAISPFLKKRLMSTVFDEVEGRFFGAAASAV